MTVDDDTRGISDSNVEDFPFLTENKFGNNKNVGIFKGWKFYRSKTTTRGVSASSPE
jgi:hypothetical protein